MIFFRSLIFNLVLFCWTIVVLIALLPVLLMPRHLLVKAVRLWVFSIFGLQRRLLKLEFEFRGQSLLPDGPFIIASAHQSAWDTIAFYAITDDPAYVLKKELYRVPMFAAYARRLKMIAIDRSAGAGAVRRMIRKVKERLENGQSVIIFPGGTRSAPDEIAPLKSGIKALYRRCGVPVVPVALNSGYFWGRRSFIKKPGVIIVEFQEPIVPGCDGSTFDTLLTQRIHSGNQRLLREARGH
ncbi:MAG: lysophospholipid acyltransferase family protein [Pseudomonadota bacterium]|nr:lysophospholipid acyltransferase family protein [Pseudomonadota bacterium]